MVLGGDDGQHRLALGLGDVVLLAGGASQVPAVQQHLVERDPSFEPGTYSVEWFAVNVRSTVQGEDTSAEITGPVRFQSPSPSEPSLLYLKSTGRLRL